MNFVQQYVEKLDDQEKVLIINGYEQLEKDGVIGNDPIRLHAQALVELAGTSGNMIVIWMEKLAFECYRYFTGLYLRKNS